MASPVPTFWGHLFSYYHRIKSYEEKVQGHSLNASLMAQLFQRQIVPSDPLALIFPQASNQKL